MTTILSSPPPDDAGTGDYAAFLSSKRMVAPSSGLQVSVIDVHPRLFPFQRSLVAWAAAKGRAALFAQTGLGKTLMQCEWARLCGQRTLIIAPLSVARQTIREAATIGLEVMYARSQQETGPGISITNYEMAAHFDAAAFGAVVCDECFAPGTEVDTPLGKKYIEDIRYGDEIYNAAGTDTVADIHRREVPYAIRIRVAGQSIVSSPNHPYFTQRGWIAAQDLQPGDAIIPTIAAVRMVRGGYIPQGERGPILQSILFREVALSTARGARKPGSGSAAPETSTSMRAVRGHFRGRPGPNIQAVLQSILLSEMAHEPIRTPRQSAYARGGEEAWRQAPSLVCVGQSQGGSGAGAYQGAEPHGTSRSAREDQPPIERDAPRSFRAWGQRAWLDAAPSSDAGCTWIGLDSGICFVTGAADSRLSDQLQARLSQSRAENRYRGGWSLACEQETPGRQEGCETGFPGVDSLEVLQPGHPDLDRYRDADGKFYFYDLGATRHPSFSVAGLLVHNSSILKGLDGKTRKALTAQFAATPYRLCCTATPAPNDITELANHAEFLGVMRRQDMLAAFFVHDDDGWRLKGHAARPFYRWLASWAMACRTPSDLGPAYSDEGYVLPPLSISPVWVDVDVAGGEGQLFFTGLQGITDRSRVRRATLAARVEATVALVRAGSAGEKWVIWCGLNDEQDALAAAFGEQCVSVYGSLSVDEKVRREALWREGDVPILLTKASVLGWGMNWQHCAHMAFVGLSDSWESYYQCIRRCYRFGQTRPVTVHIVLSQVEEGIYQNVMRKEAEAAVMSEQLIEYVSEFERAELLGVLTEADYQPAVPMQLPAWLQAS